MCRSIGQTPRRWLFGTPADLAEIVTEDLRQLRLAGVKPTAGDIRCIVYGHWTRMAIWNLRWGWNQGRPAREKLDGFAKAVAVLGDFNQVIEYIDTTASPMLAG